MMTIKEWKNFTDFTLNLILLNGGFKQSYYHPNGIIEKW
jgi:hypothetical protein